MVPYKVFVMLGFHTSFHHSWRGDTPDEAGFGTDIRVVRQILRILEQAAAEGTPARAYWDIDVYWTLQEILPRHAADIVDGIRGRVQAGQDQVVLGYFNNGANHAATERELRAAVSWAVENPAGSGFAQVFGRAPSILRPQESMYTAGMNQVLLEEGIRGVILYYAGVPFNALSTFVPTLPPQQRYNPFWLRCRPDEPAIVAWPCISPPDLIEEVSLEALLLKLRRLQTSGRVQSDLLVHLNFDADADTWLPVNVPRAFAWFPNAGGLWEYIRTVYRYPWAEFTVPDEYLADHPPQGEVLVRQDLADGGFDGNYSWAEKHTSQLNWTRLEQSRLSSYRADALARWLAAPPPRLDELLWQGPDSAFFARLVGLTTTHFGMSTPVINDQRQAKAEQILGAAAARAEGAERQAAEVVRAPHRPEGDLLYAVELVAPRVEVEVAATRSNSQPRPAAGEAGAADAVVRLPLILPAGVASLRVTGPDGEPVAASLVNVQPLGDGRRACELLFLAPAGSESGLCYRVMRAAGTPEAAAGQARLAWRVGQAAPRLANRWLELCLSTETGIDSLACEGRPVGGAGFLEPFIAYRTGRRPRAWSPAGYVVPDLGGETWSGLSRARLETWIEMTTPGGPAASRLQYTFTLFDELPYLLVDVEVDYAATLPGDAIHTIQQKLRRLLDLRWIEVAPFQLHPAFGASRERPWRVWKHNYLDVTSYYDLDYGRVNARNRDLDAFNHQVTAGWVAVSNGDRGLLLAECADRLASMAFCPMRLRERGGVQRLWLNPFGSYYGRQLDHRHLGGSGVGAELTAAVSAALRPNGPSFNGQGQRFSLLLAPYAGDEPPASLQDAALAFFYPMGAVYVQTPPDVDALLPADLRRTIAADLRTRPSEQAVPPAAPRALLVSPASGAVDLAWEPVRDGRVDGYEVRYQRADAAVWHTLRTPPGARAHVAGLEDGQAYRFQVRALSGPAASEWSAVARTRPGAVKAGSLASAVPRRSWWTLVRLVGYSLWHTLRARLRRKEPRSVD